MNVFLCKYHVLRCPKCGHLKTSTSRKKTRCVSCAHGWEISKNGQTFGVLASFWLPSDATAYIQKVKENRETIRKESLSLNQAFSLLGLNSNCSEDDFKAEYRRRAMLYHPDLNGGSEIAQTMFLEVTNAANHIRTAMGW